MTNHYGKEHVGAVDGVGDAVPLLLGEGARAVQHLPRLVRHLARHACLRAVCPRRGGALRRDIWVSVRCGEGRVWRIRAGAGGWAVCVSVQVFAWGQREGGRPFLSAGAAEQR